MKLALSPHPRMPYVRAVTPTTNSLREVTLLLLGSAVPLVAAAATAILGPVHPAPRHPVAAAAPVVFGATDYAFTGMPTHVRAGWVTVKMVNHGRELHMLATFNVPHGLTAAMTIDSIMHAHLPAGAREWGGPNAVAPGDTGTVTLHLQPGEYVVGCFVTSADGKTHFAKGMMGSLHVDAPATAAPTPSSDAKVTLTTYGIALSAAPLHAGMHTFDIHNAAREGHDLVILKVAPGHSVADALDWFTNPPTGAPAGRVVAATTGLHTGEDAFLSANLTPGNYVLLCWMQTGGKYHYRLGMNHAFTVAS